MSGIGEEMGDVGLAIQRAEDKTAQMQARGQAIDELIASGALDYASQLNAGDDISRELDALSSGSDVEAELARLKAASTPQAIESGDEGGDILAAEPDAVRAEGESSGNEGGRA
jgi:phage shock protein A